MADRMVTLSEEDKARLAQMRQRAISTRWCSSSARPAAPVKPARSDISYKGLKKPLFTAKTKAFFKKPEQSEPESAHPDFNTTIVPQQNTQPVQNEIELTREECFCAVMDILLDGMAKADKTSKDAAKNLLLVMNNEVTSSVSLLVYNSYVRKYNILREQCFLSTAANIKAKTIRISAEIIERLEQMAKTMQIELPPGFSLPPAR
ncbi:MAG: hypothetical protein A2283_21680 [Lentisphaerae bacterium RIFOXYA12_FULL_48_11]|nr:MAG: hypothetical protein A2283_21680 [Lentisphaerae bacterium RIFOXYA12_FULL_48_11]